MSISCCGAVRVGTGLEDGVGAGATKARRISSVVAIRMKSWSLTMHKPEFPAGTVMKTREKAIVDSRDLPSTTTSLKTPLTVNDSSVFVYVFTSIVKEAMSC